MFNAVLSAVSINHFNVRLAFEVLPFGIKCVEYLLDKVAIGGGFLADLTLAPTVNPQACRQLTVIAVELSLFGIGLQAVKLHFARFANPQDMVVECVFLRCEHLSQFIDSWLVVQIHV